MQPYTFQINQNLAWYTAGAAVALLAAGWENLSENGQQQKQKMDRDRAGVLLLEALNSVVLGLLSFLIIQDMNVLLFFFSEATRAWDLCQLQP